MLRANESTLLEKYRTKARQQEYLSVELEQQLTKQAKSSDPKVAEQARDRIISAHIRLAFHYATRYSKRIEGNVLSKEDLVQEASVAMCYALSKFDPSQNVRFATYAKYWICAYLDDHLHTHGYQLKYSNSRDAKVTAKVYPRIYERYSKLPLTPKEMNEAIAKELCVSPFVVEQMSSTIIHYNSPKELDRRTSLFGEDDYNPELADNSPSPEELVNAVQKDNLLGKRVTAAISSLKPREQDIIRLRHLAEDPATLEMLGERWKISKERIRQLEVKALGLLHKQLKDLAPVL